MEENVLVKFDLMKKPVPKKQSTVKVRVPVKIPIIDKRDSGYNRMDFRARLFDPVTALPLLPLSSKASTDSCNILFSFLVIMSGALRSSNLFSLLFLFITLL